MSERSVDGMKRKNEWPVYVQHALDKSAAQSEQAKKLSKKAERLRRQALSTIDDAVTEVADGWLRAIVDGEIDSREVVEQVVVWQSLAGDEDEDEGSVVLGAFDALQPGEPVVRRATVAGFVTAPPEVVALRGLQHINAGETFPQAPLCEVLVGIRTIQGDMGLTLEIGDLTSNGPALFIGRTAIQEIANDPGSGGRQQLGRLVGELHEQRPGLIDTTVLDAPVARGSSRKFARLWQPPEYWQISGRTHSHEPRG